MFTVLFVLLVILLIASIFYRPIPGTYAYAPSVFLFVLLVILALFVLHIL